jgi:Na+-driven multidrug efflux pump
MATVLSLVIGIPAVWRFGVAGAVWGINTSDVLSWILLVWLLQQKVAGRASIIERLPWSKPTARPLAEDLPSQ